MVKRGRKSRRQPMPTTDGKRTRMNNEDDDFADNPIGPANPNRREVESEPEPEVEAKPGHWKERLAKGSFEKWVEAYG